MPVTTAANKVRCGLSNLHYAVISEVSAAGVPTYGAWKALPLAVSLTTDLQSQKAVQYADDVAIYTTASTTSISITLEVSRLSDDFKKDVLGWFEGSDGGLIQPIGAISKRIALGVEFKGDAKKCRHIFFMCSVEDHDDCGGSTNTDNVSFTNETLTLTALPVTIGDDYVVKERIDEGATGYASCFTGTFTLPTKKGD